MTLFKKCTGSPGYKIPAHDNVPISEFGRNSSKKDLLQNVCRTCKNMMAAIYRAENPEKVKNSQATWRASNLENEKNRFAEYHAENRLQINERRRRQYAEDPIKFRKQSLAHRNANLEKTKKRANNYKKKRMGYDAIFRITQNLRSRTTEVIHNVLAGLNVKSAPTRELMGLSSWDDLKPYLEPLLWPGMTWDNYGRYGWVLDHIVPIASFDKTDPHWQFKAFHYTNLQPLWAEHNLWKHDRILTDSEWQYLWDLKAQGWLPEHLRDKAA